MRNIEVSDRNHTLGVYTGGIDAARLLLISSKRLVT